MVRRIDKKRDDSEQARTIPFFVMRVGLTEEPENSLSRPLGGAKYSHPGIPGQRRILEGSA